MYHAQTTRVNGTDFKLLVVYQSWASVMNFYKYSFFHHMLFAYFSFLVLAFYRTPFTEPSAIVHHLCCSPNHDCCHFVPCDPCTTHFEKFPCLICGRKLTFDESKKILACFAQVVHLYLCETGVSVCTSPAVIQSHSLL